MFERQQALFRTILQYRLGAWRKKTESQQPAKRNGLRKTHFNPYSCPKSDLESPFRALGQADLRRRCGSLLSLCCWLREV